VPSWRHEQSDGARAGTVAPRGGPPHPPRGPLSSDASGRRPLPFPLGDRTAVVATTVVAVLPLLVAIPLVLVDGMTAPNGDDALIELRVRDVWGIDSPLTGSYGRFGWNHPGPLLFYVLSVPYRLVGARFAGLQVGTLLLGIASVVGIAWVAARRGGAVLALWALFVVSVLVHGLGPRVLSDPWEPHSTCCPSSPPWCCGPSSGWPPAPGSGGGGGGRSDAGRCGWPPAPPSRWGWSCGSRWWWRS
jgi:hypothetical protein